MPAKPKLTAKDREAIASDKARDEEELRQRESRAVFYRMFEKTAPFEMLDESLRSNRAFHAYLLHGPRGSLKDDAAKLFGVSILCGSRGLLKEEEADEETRLTALQAYRGDHSDFIFLNGNRKEQIKKEEVDDIQSRFSRTASSKAGRKVYIITHAENSSSGAMNGLLKFLEEPAENVFAILTADNIERILPTIRSRCITVQFQPVGQDVIMEYCRSLALDEEDVWFLSHIAPGLEDIGLLAAGRSYQTAKRMFRQYLNIDGERDLLFVDYEYRYRSKAGSDAGEGVRYKDARDENLDTLNFFFGLLVMYYHDVLANDEQGPEWYHKAVNIARRSDGFLRVCTDKAKIAVAARDRVNRSNDLSLLFAQAIAQLEEVSDDQ